ncbi:MAG: hypothetical protein IJD59_05660 [Clostridia bacterium]|nr:hypothetical protein [Clostridia bacterium]
MIQFDLFKKDDFILLLDSFDTVFLQYPMKHPPKSVQKYIPKGFRPEKLTRFHLLKVYADALNAKETFLTVFIQEEIERRFRESGIEAYFSEKNGLTEAKDRYILELSALIMEKDMVLPAHLALMLFGVPCSQEEKALSQRLHEVYRRQTETAEKMGREEGIREGEEKSAEELETEKRKSAKLQKTVDAMTKKSLEDAQTIEQWKKENETLSSANGVAQRMIDDLKAESNRQTQEILALERKEAEILIEQDKLLQKVRSMESEIREMEISEALLKEICQKAIAMLATEHEKRERSLSLAKTIFTRGEDVPTAWRLLCEESASKIENACHRLTAKEADSALQESFAEVESLLLLQSAIQKCLCALTYRQLADRTAAGNGEGGYTVDHEKS